MDAETEIPKWYQPAFRQNVESLLRKGESRLRGTFEEGTYTGDGGEVVKQYGKTKARRGGGAEDRYGDTPIMSTPLDDRWVYPEVVDWGDLFETLDKLKMLTDITSPIMAGAGQSMGEELDEIMIESFFATAKTGKNGSINTPFPNDGSQDVAITVGSADGATSVGMNVAKLKKARRILESRYVKFGREPVYVGLSSQEREELMGDPQFIDRDYGETVLDSGNLKPFLGFTFIQLEEWETNANGTIRYLPVWPKSRMHLGVWENLRTEMGKDPGKKFNVRAFMQQSFGGSRKEEKGIVRINSKISA